MKTVLNEKEGVRHIACEKRGVQELAKIFDTIVGDLGYKILTAKIVLLDVEELTIVEIEKENVLADLILGETDASSKKSH